MRTRRSVFFTLLANFALLAYFRHESIRLDIQVISVIRDAGDLEQSNEVLLERILTASNNDKRVVRELQSNYLRLKQLAEYTKNNQIRIKGIPEGHEEDLEKKVIELVESMDVKINSGDIQRLHRLAVGKKQSKSSPRVVVVELANLNLKTQILRKAASALATTAYLIQDGVTSHAMPVGFSRVEHVNVTEGCGYISSVSDPETKSQSKKVFGAWLQDPISSSNTERDKFVWILPNFYDNNLVEEYASIQELSRRRKRATYKLPYEWGGTGHVVYNMSLYFVPFNSSNIVRYHFGTKSVLKERKIPEALSGNNAAYQWAGSTDIDLSCDVNGLWAIYATNENSLDIVISRIDPITLQLIQTWKTNWRKQWSGNAFMMCGVLYVLKKYDEQDTALSYIYDTRLRRYKHVNIPFSNKYEWNSMLEYNFRRKQIYAWDRGYLVSYDVKLSQEMPD